jgi:hypothetical protein
MRIVGIGLLVAVLGTGCAFETQDGQGGGQSTDNAFVGRSNAGDPRGGHGASSTQVSNDNSSPTKACPQPNPELAPRLQQNGGCGGMGDNSDKIEDPHPSPWKNSSTNSNPGSSSGR